MPTTLSPNVSICTLHFCWLFEYIVIKSYLIVCSYSWVFCVTLWQSETFRDSNDRAQSSWHMSRHCQLLFQVIAVSTGPGPASACTSEPLQRAWAITLLCIVYTKAVLACYCCCWWWEQLHANSSLFPRTWLVLDSKFMSPFKFHLLV